MTEKSPVTSEAPLRIEYYADTDVLVLGDSSVSHMGPYGDSIGQHTVTIYTNEDGDTVGVMVLGAAEMLKDLLVRGETAKLTMGPTVGRIGPNDGHCPICSGSGADGVDQESPTSGREARKRAISGPTTDSPPTTDR